MAELSLENCFELILHLVEVLKLHFVLLSLVIQFLDLDLIFYRILSGGELDGFNLLFDVSELGLNLRGLQLKDEFMELLQLVLFLLFIEIKSRSHLDSVPLPLKYCVILAQNI